MNMKDICPITVANLVDLGFFECEDHIYKTNCHSDPVVRFEEGELRVYHDPRSSGENFFEVIRGFKSYSEFLEWFNLTTEASGVPHSARTLSTPETLGELSFVRTEDEPFTFLSQNDRYPLVLKLRGEFSWNPTSERYLLEVRLTAPDGATSHVTSFDHHADFARWLEITYPSLQ